MSEELCAFKREMNVIESWCCPTWVGPDVREVPEGEKSFRLKSKGYRSAPLLDPRRETGKNTKQRHHIPIRSILYTATC
jgi:hypothetical protein